MEKITNISGFCPFQDENVTIKIVCEPYNVTGAYNLVSITNNMCEHKINCPYENNCPVEDQPLFWNEL